MLFLVVNKWSGHRTASNLDGFNVGVQNYDESWFLINHETVVEVVRRSMLYLDPLVLQ